MDTYVKWTDEEWQSVAKRARALKDAKPDLTWMQIAVVTQDDIAPERRRFSFNKLSALKPMFDILGLDHEGNVPPPPPPPPAPEPVIATPPFAVAAPAKLSDVPTDALVTEILSRGAALKTLAEDVVATRKVIEDSMAKHIERMTVLDKRVDEMEELVLKLDERFTEAMNFCLQVKEDYVTLSKVNQLIRDTLDKCSAENLRNVASDVAEAAVKTGAIKLNGYGHTPAPEVKRIAALRFLLVGPMQKDIARIKERLPRSLNVELIFGENSDHMKLPSNIDYCVVSGHADYTRRWQTCRETYGQSRVHRMENGSIGTFANQIEILASLHNKHHAQAA